jgi:tetratricopeptide (TPR) repeat protein
MRRSAAAVVLSIALIPVASAQAFRETPIGATIKSRKMPTLAGKAESFPGSAKANVFVFFRTDHDHSEQALKQLATLEKEFAGKPVRFLAVVSSEEPRDAAAAMVRDAGVRMPVLVDEKDALYGELGVVLYPTIGIIDGHSRLAAYQPYRRLNLLDATRGRIQVVLGELTEAQLAAVLDPPASEVKVNRALARANLARKLLQADAVELAVQSARAAVAMEPGHAENHAVLAEALARGGNCDEAAREAAQARKLDPAAPSPPACTAKR